MALGTTLTGFLAAPQQGLSVNAPGTHILPQGARGGYLANTVASGPVTGVLPLTIRSVDQTGNVAASFRDDWYNRIHVSPRVIAFGAVSGGSTRSTTLWNAYLSNTTLTDITTISDDGVTLAGTSLPRTLGPLATLGLTVTVGDVGPATVDTSYLFEFDRPDTLTLQVTGRRAKIWPFAPNWSDPVDVELEFRTDVTTSRSGREQRRALRRTPRRTISYKVTIADEDMRGFNRLMATWQSRPMLMPDPVRFTYCPDGMPSNGTVVRVDSVPAWLTTGRTVVLEASGESELYVVSEIDSGTGYITLDSGASHAWPAGTKMRLAVSGLLSGNLRARHPISRVTEFTVTFAVDPGSEPIDEGDPGTARLNGREVLLAKPNWGETVESTFIWAPEQIDFGFGTIQSSNPRAYGLMARRAVFLATSRDLEQFFCRQRGQRGEFLMPTWLNDLPLKETAVGGTTFFRVAGSETFDDYAGHPVYKAIAVILSNGDHVYREVTGITVDTAPDGSTDSIVTVDKAWSTDITVDDVAMVSWMPVNRFATDQVTFEWLTDGLMQVNLPVQTLEYLAAENALISIEDVDGVVLLEDLDTFDLMVNVIYPEIFA